MDVFVINSDLIEFIEATPDTLITLTTGRRVIVRESIDQVLDKIVKFRQLTQPIKIKRHIAEDIST
jgi:flagellar protein FlbD